MMRTREQPKLQHRKRLARENRMCVETPWPNVLNKMWLCDPIRTPTVVNISLEKWGVLVNSQIIRDLWFLDAKDTGRAESGRLRYKWTKYKTTLWESSRVGLCLSVVLARVESRCSWDCIAIFPWLSHFLFIFLSVGCCSSLTSAFRHHQVVLFSARPSKRCRMFWV